MGISHDNVNETNFGVLIFAKEDKPQVTPVSIASVSATASKKLHAKRERTDIEEEDISELKQAFDLFDKDGSATIKIDDAIEAMK